MEDDVYVDLFYTLHRYCLDQFCDKTYVDTKQWHMFEQMYVDEVDFRETLAHDQLIGLVFTEFVHRQMQQLEELETACVKTGIAHSPVTKMREHCEITDEDDRWLTYADKSESDRVKRDKNHNRQKILRFGVSFGRNDLNLENHLQIGYNSKTIKKLWTY